MTSAQDTSTALEQIRTNPELTAIHLTFKKYSDTDVIPVFECLLTHPNNVSFITLIYNDLTDETGDIIAKYIASSNCIKRLDLYRNNFTEKTHLKIAKALCFNTSLEILLLTDDDSNNNSDFPRESFINAMRINPVKVRLFQIYIRRVSDFACFLKIAENSTPPSMLEFLLYAHKNA